MKQRHVVAVALAAWYLMSPPVMRIPRYGAKANPTALLHYWKIIATYESRSACETARAAVLAATETNPEQAPDALSDLSPLDMISASRAMVCVASDDPRLDKRW
jgi:hypothetical protein